MARFESRNISGADVPAPREAIWEAVTSPACLTELTPLIERIDSLGDLWTWQLKSVSALGVHAEPSFTEQMTFDEGRTMTFQHRPPAGKAERAGAVGTYTLADVPDGVTHLEVDLTLHVELPLPSLSRRAVERVMATMMARTGEQFAANLYAHLGIAKAPGPILSRTGS